MLVTEMVSEIADQLSNTEADDKIIRWLNMEQDDLVSCYRFNILQKTATINTAAATRNYLFSAFTPSVTDLTLIKEIRIPAIPRKLHPIEENELAEAEPDWDVAQGTIYRYIFRGNGIDLWRVPDGIHTLNMTYYRGFTKLLNDGTNPTETSEVPYQWHPFLVQKALVRGMRQQDHPRLDRELVILASMEDKFRKHHRTRPDAVHVFQSPEKSNRKPHPVLPPDHFPRSS